MKINRNILIFSSLAFLTGILVLVGLLYNKTEDEKQNGLTELYDISREGIIAYVINKDGEQQIKFSKDGLEQEVVSINKEKVILDIAFSPDGSSLAYSVINRDVESDLVTTINIIDVDKLEEDNLFQKSGMITEIAFDPKDETNLFYLKADTFENYSPIARANPHNFDIYKYDMTGITHDQLTDWKKYSIDSLQVSASDESVYIQMFNDETAQTAEEIFDANLRIFNVPLKEPDKLSIVSDPKKEIDIYDFTVLSGEEKIIYQSVSNPHSGGTFQYELFEYDSTTNKEVQLTNLKEYTSRPIVHEEHIYFIVDKQFAQKYSDYYLYKMDLDGENIRKVELND
ncbi:hypothetical protein SPD48_11490 [Pseudogracilibacillus sp. SE30717A]|uniref:hypothetical protein n=1 Tax=Pseudogracilibacillus sp. SE30717A TaxID=3098293 RepID=UPI00300E0B29